MPRPRTAPPPRQHPAPALVPRFRVLRNGEIALGPGKADLLEAILRTGSLRLAAKELGMSYMRAWNLVHEMTEAFAAPLVESERGGDARGGTRLTTEGEEVLRLYRELEESARSAAAPAWKKLRKKLRR